MRKLLIHIVLFLVPLLVVLVVLPVNHRQKYKGLLNDCFNQGLWIHDRITDNETEIKMAFIGSSKTITGIDDALFNALDSTANSVNLAYCRLGRDMSFHIINELLDHREVEKIVIEVREDENRGGHPVYPLIAETHQLLHPRNLLDQSFMQKYWKHFAYKVELFQERLYQRHQDALIRWEDHGHTSHDDTVAVLSQTRTLANQMNSERQFKTAFNGIYSKTHLKAIAKLCETQHVKLYFLYLPKYNSQQRMPLHSQLYMELGTLLIMDQELFNDPNNWHDLEHLNTTGAQKLTKRLYSQLRGLEKEG